jgi:hypothetical protein
VWAIDDCSALEQLGDRAGELEHVPTELLRNDDDEKIAFALAVARKPIKEVAIDLHFSSSHCWVR